MARGRPAIVVRPEKPVLRVSIDGRGSELQAGRPEPLFTGPFDINYTNYTVARDGTYCGMVEVDPDARPTQVSVVLNCVEEVKQLAASRR